MAPSSLSGSTPSRLGRRRRASTRLRSRPAWSLWLVEESRRRIDKVLKRGSAGCPQHGCELLARPDLELVVDVAKVVFDRLWAQVQLRRGLAGRPSFGQRERHLELLGCQRVAGVVVTHAGRLPACDQLGEGPRRPGAGAGASARGQRGA